MGRRKKLPIIQYLDGNPSKTRLQERGVEALGEPFIPKHLMKDAQHCIQVIKTSMPQDVYAAADSYALAAFGMAWAIHKRAAEEIAKSNFQWIVLTQRRSQAYSPWLRIMTQQAAYGPA